MSYQEEGRGKQDLAGEWSLEQVMVSRKRIRQDAQGLRCSASEYAAGCAARQSTRAGWSTVWGGRHDRAPGEGSMSCTGSTRPHPEPAPLKAVKPSSSRQACQHLCQVAKILHLPATHSCTTTSTQPVWLHRSDLVCPFQVITVPRYSAPNDTTVQNFTIQKYYCTCSFLNSSLSRFSSSDLCHLSSSVWSCWASSRSLMFPPTQE